MWKHAKNSMKELKRPNSVFYAGYVRSSLLKAPKTCKTRETKTRITQNFPVVWLIQGSTMSKSMPRAFRKCGTFWYFKVLNQSYWLSKSGQIGGKKFLEWRLHKKKTRLQYSVHRPHMNRIRSSHGQFDVLFISGLKTTFCDVAYFRGRVENFRLCWLWAAVTPVQKLENPISSTFLKPPGRQLSIGATHIGSTASECQVIVGNTKKYVFWGFWVSEVYKNVWWC